MTSTKYQNKGKKEKLFWDEISLQRFHPFKRIIQMTWNFSISEIHLNQNVQSYNSDFLLLRTRNYFFRKQALHFLPSLLLYTSEKEKIIFLFPKGNVEKLKPMTKNNLLWWCSHKGKEKIEKKKNFKMELFRVRESFSPVFILSFRQTWEQTMGSITRSLSCLFFFFFFI